MRVIAGRLGGRKLVAPKGSGTRPTADRVKEALFSILGHLGDAVVLDLYAGTGGLGIEALSRGAARAVFVESAPQAQVALKKNLDDLGLAAVSQIVPSRVERAGSRIQTLGPFDCALVDPPYADVDQAVAALEALVARGAFTEHANLVLEHEAGASFTRASLEVLDQRSYGTTGLTFFRPRREPEA